MGRNLVVVGLAGLMMAARAPMEAPLELHRLAHAGDVAALRSALESDPAREKSLETRDDSGFTPLLIAVATGNNAAVRFIFFAVTVSELCFSRPHLLTEHSY